MMDGSSVERMQALDHAEIDMLLRLQQGAKPELSAEEITALRLAKKEKAKPGLVQAQGDAVSAAAEAERRRIRNLKKRQAKAGERLTKEKTAHELSPLVYSAVCTAGLGLLLRLP